MINKILNVFLTISWQLMAEVVFLYLRFFWVLWVSCQLVQSETQSSLLPAAPNSAKSAALHSGENGYSHHLLTADSLNCGWTQKNTVPNHFMHLRTTWASERSSSSDLKRIRKGPHPSLILGADSVSFFAWSLLEDTIPWHSSSVSANVVPVIWKNDSYTRKSVKLTKLTLPKFKKNKHIKVI